jgi:hypothetical protein
MEVPPSKISGPTCPISSAFHMLTLGDYFYLNNNNAKHREGLRTVLG